MFTSVPVRFSLSVIFFLLFLSGLTGCRSGLSVSSEAGDLPTTAAESKSEETRPLATPLPQPFLSDLSPVPTTIATPGLPASAPTAIPPSPTSSATAVPCSAPDLPGAGRWCFSGDQGNLFIHPVAVDIWEDNLYVLDAGRVLKLPGDDGHQPEILLRPGDDVAGLPVLEPLDLSASPAGLHVLDRAGNVYRHDWSSGEWLMERNDRPIEDASSHYYAALDSSGDSRFLTETSYSYGIRFDDRAPESGYGWSLEEGYYIDLAAWRVDKQSQVHLLLQRRETRENEIVFYDQGEINRRFKARLEIDRPRGLVRWGDQLFLLDQGGWRVTVMEAATGLVIEERSLNLPFSVSAMAVDDGGRIILASRDAVYFFGVSTARQIVPHPGLLLSGRWPHDPNSLTYLPTFLFPIENLPIADRDLRMPGAPRHYRLGIHEGVDFYWGPGRQVRAAGAGVVIRAQSEFPEPSAVQFGELRALAANLGASPPAVVDFFRGRQVWIDHGGGIVTRYAHLQEIMPGIIEGQTIQAGQLIGTVGNSGSPGSLVSPSEDAHLHFEVWIDDHYLGQFLRPLEIREIFESLFGDK